MDLSGVFLYKYFVWFGLGEFPIELWLHLIVYPGVVSLVFWFIIGFVLESDNVRCGDMLLVIIPPSCSRRPGRWDRPIARIAT